MKKRITSLLLVFVMLLSMVPPAYAGDLGSSQTRTTSGRIDDSTIWSYVDDGSVADTDWNTADYNDSGWRTGVGPFGSAGTVGKIASGTVLNGCNGTNSIPTYLFRTEFTVDESDLDSIRQLVGVLECDAATVVYLNGTKIYEYGEVGTDGYATAEPGAQHSEPIVITNPSALQAGVNTVAVEVHNSGAADKDMWFHLNLAPNDGKQEQIDEFSVWSWFYERTAEGTHTDPAGDPAAEDYDRLSWTEADFDDSSWRVGVGPFGSQSKATPFGNVTPAEIAATLLPDVDRENNPPTYFLRTDLYLSAETLRNLEEIQASIIFDDAAIVYINGAEVYRSTTAKNVTENIQYSGGTAKAIVDSFSVTDFADLNLHVGRNTVAIELHQESEGSNDIWLDFEMDTVTGENYSIDDSTVWAYLDNGEAVRDGWNAPAYDDSDWNVGVGPFGPAETVNNVAVGTVLDGCDGEKSIPAYYYRTQFIVREGELKNIEQLVGSLEYDDAAAVYLNGEKICEVGEAEDGGYAKGETGRQQAQPIVLTDLSALREGVNTIAVEVHNSGAADKDTWFHLNLAPDDGKQEALNEQTVWRYLADRTDPAGDSSAEGYDRLVWTAEAYDDSKWLQGVGPFGCQGGGAAYQNVTPPEVAGTKLPGVDAKDNYESYFFRTDLYIAEEDLANIGSFNGNISFDDGVIVYINGVPVYEGYTSSKADKITQNIQYTGAGGNPTPTEFRVTDISSLNLHAGNNTVAVELHQDRIGGGDIWLDLQLEPSAERVEQLTNIIMNMGADETQMNFTWYTPSAAAGNLLLAKYDELVDGEMPADAAALAARSARASDGKYVNNVTAINLEKGTRYAYQVVSGAHKSDVYSFTTPDGDGSFDFAFVADIQIVGDDNANWTTSLNKIVEQFDPAFLLSAGDQVNVASSEEEYDALLDLEQLRSLPFAPVIGNHDNKKQYKEHYESANESAIYGVTDGGGDAYFVYDNVLFMILNSNDKSAEEHKLFMEQAIAETKAAGVDIKWKVAALHHSFYSKVSSGEFDRLDLRTTFMPVFAELDIDVVFSGHDHVYARSYLLDGVDHIEENLNYTYDENNIPVSVTDPQGILYVAGSSPGYRQNAMSSTAHPCVAVQGMRKTPSISKVQVTDDSFTVTTYYVDTMEILDTFTINKTEQNVVPDQTDVSLMVGADETQMNVTWYSDAAGTGIVKLAKQAELVNGAMPENARTFTATGNESQKLNYYSYQTTMDNLEPNTTYAYQLVNTGVESDIYTFTTDGSNEFSFVFVGDPQIGASGGSSADAVANDTKSWHKTLDIVEDNEIFSDAAFMLSAGDQVNTANSEHEYTGFLGHDLMTQLPLAPVIGNHDTRSNAYDQHFNVPNESAYGKTAAGGDYSFVYNNALFLVINTNSASVAEHMDFVKSAIAANPDVDWKIVTFHHSVYTVASHSTEESIIGLRNTIAPLMKELGIDVVLMGHDHVYCRTYIMDGLNPITDPARYDNAEFSSVTDPEGPLYVTANSGSGSKHYNIKSMDFPYSAVQNQEKVANVSKVSISEDQFNITTYRTTDMSVVDTFTINHSGGDIEAPAELVGIEVTAQPAKTVYKAGETFDPTGMVITATYSDSTTREVTDYTVTPAGALTAADTVVSVTYEDKTVSVAITVQDDNTGDDTAEPAKLIINQVYGDGEKDETPIANSFVEIYNLNNEPVSLAGYTLTYGDQTLTLDASKSIPANGSYLIVGAAADTTDEFKTYDLPAADQTCDWTIDNKEYTIELKNRDTILDSVTAGDSDATKVSKQKSLQRIDHQDTDADSDFRIVVWEKGEMTADESSLAQYAPHNSKGEYGSLITDEPEDTVIINTTSATGLVKYLSSYSTGNTNADGGVAEIVKFNEENDCMYLVSGQTQTLDIVKVNADGSTTLVKQVDIAALGEANDFSAGDITSVDVNTDRDLVAIAVQNADYTANGVIVTLNYDGEFVARYEAGVQPDMLTFAPNGNYILSANEGEPRDGYGEGVTDPMGSVTVVDLAAGNAAAYTFESLDGSRDALINDGVLLKADTAPSVDLEPEFIVVAPDSRTAYVTLQENNAVAALDLTNGTWKYVKGLGFKDHSAAGNGLDLDQDGSIDIRNENVYGVYMPDGIDLVTIGGKDYLITANEGDAREWGDYANIDSAKLVLADGAEAGKKIEFLDTTKTDGLTAGNIYILGGRSFSIWNADTLEQVFDSGDDFEVVTAAEFPEYFNSGHDEAGLDKRSHKKGVEPESVTVLETNGKVYAIVGLERMGGIMVYDISDPAKATYADYLNVRGFSDTVDDLDRLGDLGPEGICTIPAENSPTGNAMILVANEVSGTVTVAQIEKVSTDDDTSDDSSDDDDDRHSSSSSGRTSYTITVEDTANGTMKVDRTRAASGTIVTLTVIPDTGCTLESLSVTTVGGKKVELTNKGNGKYTFKMPGSKVTVKAAFADAKDMPSFSDVSAEAYYYDAVLWAAESGITSGTTADTFSPDKLCTRAQMAAFLWRAAGSPEPVGSTNPFADVSADAYYAKAVQWAYEQDITGGTSAAAFSPDKTCTRAQMATFLWRAAGSPAALNTTNPFADVPADAYYAKAIQWAYDNDITGGTSATAFSPDNGCTRAQMVTFLYRCFSAK